jgi:hypothetical protein
MSHFPNPFQVTPQAALGSIRISIRASDSRIDEWLIEPEDVLSVLTWTSTEGWRGGGSLRVMLDQNGGGVAFHSPDGTRSIVRASSGVIDSFLAHLHAAYEMLPSKPETLMSELPDISRVSKPPSNSINSALADAAEHLIDGINNLTLGHQLVLARIQQLTDAIQLLQQSIVLSAGAQPHYMAPEPTAPSVGGKDAPMYVPSLAAAIEGTSIPLTEKVSSADDLADAVSALQAVKQQKL